MWSNRLSLLRLLLRIGDPVGVFVAGIVSYYVYLYEIKNYRAVLVEQYVALLVLGVILVFFVFPQTKLYYTANLGNFWLSIRRIVTGLSIVVGGLIFLGFMAKISAGYSRGWFIIWFVSSICLLAGIRWAAVLAVRLWNVKGMTRLQTVIVGADHLGAEVGTTLSKPKDGQLEVLGYFDDRIERIKKNDTSLPILGNIRDLIEFGRKNVLDSVIIALPWSAQKRIAEIIESLKPLPVDIFLAPQGIGLTLQNQSYYYASGVGLLMARRAPISGLRLLAKEIEDKIIAIFLILLASPLMVLIAICVKIDSPGPVLFRQPRRGLKERTFEVLKFRTVYSQYCDRMGDKFIERNDDRVTPVGHFLRKTSLDELPQLFNVICGDMSLVGPRPHPLHAKVGERLYIQIVEHYARRHCIKPGITGLAQINGWRGETTNESQILNRVTNDIYYIENWSVMLDLKILIRTIPVVLKMRNAF